MRTWAAVFVLWTGLIWGQSVLAQGTARSLDIQPGARQNALGAAGVALEGDPSDALWWNPAALGFAEWQGAQYTRAMLLPGLADDIVYQHVAAGGAVGGRLGIGASGTFLSYGDLEYPFPDGESTEWSWAAAAGYRVLPELAIGLTARYVKVDLVPDVFEGSGFGFDFGALYRTNLEPVRLGAGVNLQNVGPEMSFGSSGRTYPMSRNLKVGGAVTWPVELRDEGFETGTTVLADFNQSLVTNKFRTYNFGVEAYVAAGKWARVALRGGYYDDPLGDIQDPTFGAGIRIAGATVDFGSIPQARDSGLERVQKWSFGLQTDFLLEMLKAR